MSENTFSANEVLGVSEKKADEIVRAFRHARIDHDSWTDVLNEVGKKVKTKEEYAYFGYIFGRMYQKDQDSPCGALSKILEGLHSDKE
jgi:hypothetical protein